MVPALLNVNIRLWGLFQFLLGDSLSVPRERFLSNTKKMSKKRKDWVGNPTDGEAAVENPSCDLCQGQKGGGGRGRGHAHLDGPDATRRL